jgi:hypothetical protein
MLMIAPRPNKGRGVALSGNQLSDFACSHTALILVDEQAEWVFAP